MYFSFLNHVSPVSLFKHAHIKFFTYVQCQFRLNFFLFYITVLNAFFLMFHHQSSHALQQYYEP
jgi:hypothetical protein